MGDLADQAKKGYHAVRRSTVLERLTRVGILSKGVVYLLIGALALMAAFNAGGGTTDQEGIIRRLAREPFGMIALTVIAAGLLAYALWRFICAFSDSESKGRDAKGLCARAGQLASGTAYAGLAVYAIRLLVTGSAGHRTDPAKHWTARLLSMPGGQLLVGLAGLIIIGAGIFQIWTGFQEGFREDLRTSSMSRDEKLWAIRAGKWGHAARGVVFGMIGVFLTFAAWNTDARQARGFEAVLDTIAAQPFGPWLLAIVAAGLVCYGAYCMMEARYGRIPH